MVYRDVVYSQPAVKNVRKVYEENSAGLMRDPYAKVAHICYAVGDIFLHHYLLFMKILFIIYETLLSR